MTTPSELLADSIAVFSKAAHQALAEAESNAHTQVVRATTDRDNAINALHAIQLDEQTWKQEVVSCKGALKQAELTIAHQAETISQLRREVNQWRDQSRNWQEHFLRVEQERCALSTTIEELATDGPQRTQVPSTPCIYHQRAEADFPSHSVHVSSSTRPPTQKSAPPITPAHDNLSSSMSAHKASRSATKPSKQPQPVPSPTDRPPLSLFENPHSPPLKAQRKRQSRSPLPTTETRVIRRVQAVIHVKREESDEDTTAPEVRVQRQPQVGSAASTGRRKCRKHQVKDTNTLQDESDSDTIRPSIGHGNSSPGEDSDDEDELMLVAKDCDQPSKTFKFVNGPPNRQPNKRRKTTGSVNTSRKKT